MDLTDRLITDRRKAVITHDKMDEDQEEVEDLEGEEMDQAMGRHRRHLRDLRVQGYPAPCLILFITLHSRPTRR